MPNAGNKAIETKGLTILEDQMQHEFLACKKAEFYAQTFQNQALRTLSGQMAQGHRQRYNRLFDYLNSHG